KTENISSLNNSLVENSSDNGFTILSFVHIELIIFIIVLGLIILTGLVSNIITVAVILRHKGIKSITDILVLNLA
ncbi:hypothetical protein ACJMK2_043480, partial [Sinanodonta woodiana]